MSSKIIYVTVSFPYGNGEAFIYPELIGWSELDRNVLVIPVFPRGKITRQYSKVNNLKAPLVRVGYFLHFIKEFCFRPKMSFSILKFILKRPKKFWKNLLVMPKAAYVAAQYKNSDVRHVHAHWGGVSSTFAYILSRYLGVEWSLTCHRWDIYEDNLLREKASASKFIRFISKRGAVDAQKLGVDPSKTVVIGMGVDEVERSIKGPRGGRFTIVCAANLIPVKGHYYLLDAFSILKKDGLSFNLIIYGDGYLKEDLILRSVELGLNGCVSFEGHIENQKLLSLYAAGKVDVFVLPSIDMGGGAHEGVPVSLMEAMSYGIPVVSTNTGSINELLPLSLGLTVPDKSGSELAFTISKLISDPVFYADSSNAVFSLISNYWLMMDSVSKLDQLIFED